MGIFNKILRSTTAQRGLNLQRIHNFKDQARLEPIPKSIFKSTSNLDQALARREEKSYSLEACVSRAFLKNFEVSKKLSKQSTTQTHNAKLGRYGGDPALGK
jgi:hypothetical protein